MYISNPCSMSKSMSMAHPSSPSPPFFLNVSRQRSQSPSGGSRRPTSRSGASASGSSAVAAAVAAPFSPDPVARVQARVAAMGRLGGLAIGARGGWSPERVGDDIIIM